MAITPVQIEIITVIYTKLIQQYNKIKTGITRYKANTIKTSTVTSQR